MNFDLMRSIERIMNKMEISVFCQVNFFGISEHFEGGGGAKLRGGL